MGLPVGDLPVDALPVVPTTMLLPAWLALDYPVNDEMTLPAAIPSRSPHVGPLMANAVGLTDVAVMAIATCAPITSMAGNLPLVIGLGSGLYAPGAFVFCTIIMTIFAVGYNAISRHITTAGAFYGYVSHGLGQSVGLSAGLLACLAYMVFEISLIGIFAYFVQQFLLAEFGILIGWLTPALVMLGLNWLFAYYRINIAAKILAVFLALEVLSLLTVVIASLLLNKDQSYHLQALNPLGAFQSTQGGAASFGLFMAFWSWVGFETTGMYGEESREPKRIVPRATMIAVVGVGLLYVLVAWAAIVGNGLGQSIAITQGANPIDLLLNPLRLRFGDWIATIFQLLTITGSFACGLAFHNCAARYLYAIGREGVLFRSDRWLGKTHPVYRSPYIASSLQTVFGLALLLLFKFDSNLGPYDFYALLAVIGVMAILIVQAACSVAVIGYFWFARRDQFRLWQTCIAPAIGACSMSFVVYLLFIHMDSIVGIKLAASGLYYATPWIVFGLAGFGLLVALLIKMLAPNRHVLLGRLVLEDIVAADPAIARQIAAE
ncbi:MAG TPA: APC family permease [Terriglobia bacterium]|nr:APC family permease [Terriglobia bacterium]